MTVDPKLQRVWDAYTLGYRAIRSDNTEWASAVTKAAAIAEHFRGQYSPTFEVIKPNPHLKLPHQYVDGTMVALPHWLVLSLETTWAELDYQASELDILASEIRDDVLRAKIQQTIEDLKLEIDRKKRAHLRSVP